MPARMKKHHTSHAKAKRHVRMCHEGNIYQFPKHVAERYLVSDDSVSPEDVFAEINREHTQPGILLKGIRIRENLTQAEMAEAMAVTQSDISQMEHGHRPIGKMIAKCIEKRYGVHYKVFLE